MSDIKVLIGKRVRELRKGRNLTQEEFAELIGIEPRNVMKIENAQTFPRAKTLDRILEVMEISPEYFFKFEHFDDVTVLRKKIYEKLQDDDKLVKMIYKMLF